MFSTSPRRLFSSQYFQRWIVLSLGGSVVIPNKINRKFLIDFREFILRWTRKGRKFIIFIGGGKTARYYQKEAQKIGVSSQKDLDWIGIYSTYLNASFIISLFKKRSHSKVVQDPTRKINTDKKIIIAGGWKPGRSTDYDAVRMAQTYKTKTIINLSDVDHVYDKNPDKFKNAKPLKEVSFTDFFKIIGKKWRAGLNLPFDPVASRLAQKNRIKVIILKGTDLKNLDNLLKGNRFRGTIIEKK